MRRFMPPIRSRHHESQAVAPSAHAATAPAGGTNAVGAPFVRRAGGLDPVRAPRRRQFAAGQPLCAAPPASVSARTISCANHFGGRTADIGWASQVTVHGPCGHTRFSIARTMPSSTTESTGIFRIGKRCAARSRPSARRQCPRRQLDQRGRRHPGQRLPPNCIPARAASSGIQTLHECAPVTISLHDKSAASTASSPADDPDASPVHAPACRAKETACAAGALNGRRRQHLPYTRASHCGCKAPAFRVKLRRR